MSACLQATTKVGVGIVSTDKYQEILFAFGIPRSGTTLLGRTLQDWFDCGMGPEGTFVKSFFQRAANYGDLRDEANVERLASDLSKVDMLQIIRTRYPQGRRFDVTPADIRERMPEQSLAGAIYAVFKCVADFQNHSRIGNTFQDYWQYLPVLELLFSDRAKYLYIVRDGRDVFLSSTRVAEDALSPYRSAEYWAKSVRKVLDFKDQIDEDRILVLRYEDLLMEPAKTFRSIAAFLGLTVSHAQCVNYETHVRTHSRHFHTNKWKAQMSEKDLEVFEAVAGKELQALGYHKNVPDVHANAFTHGLYRVKELWRQRPEKSRRMP